MESADNQAKPRAGIDSASSSGEPSLSKSKAIALLKESIEQIEQTIEEINNNSALVPSADSLDALLTSTRELVVIPPSNVGLASDQDSTSDSEVEPSLTVAPQEQPAQPESEKEPREQTPQKSPKLGLILVTVAIAILGLVWYFFYRPELSVTLPIQSTATEVIDDLPNSSQKISPIPIEETQQQISDQTPESPPVDSQLLEPKGAISDEETIIEVDVPASLESPGKVKELKIVTIEPQLNFTPEQILIAALQDKLAQLSQDYPAELVNSVEVDLPHNSLLIRVSQQWYDLDESLQDQIGNQMLDSSRRYGFQQLRLQDSQDILVARNPVIGKKIIVLER
ncbi:MAG: hypothetical protein AAFQ80_09975 [Cyanobacteria bacterium J06621_8]